MSRELNVYEPLISTIVEFGLLEQTNLDSNLELVLQPIEQIIYPAWVPVYLL